MAVSSVGRKLLTQVWAKATKKAPIITRKVEGIPFTTNLKTGTQVMNVNGIKSIQYGKETELYKLGLRNVVSYPSGFFGNNLNRIIYVKGTKAGKGLAFSPKEFGDFVKMLREFEKLA